MEPFRKFLLQTFHDAGRSVRRAILDHEDVIPALERKYRPDDLFYILLLVISRYDYNFLVHICLFLNCLHHFCDSRLQLLVLAAEY